MDTRVPIVIRKTSTAFDVTVDGQTFDVAARLEDMREARAPEREINRFLGDMARMLCNLRGIKNPQPQPPTTPAQATRPDDDPWGEGYREESPPMSMRLRRAA